MDDWLTFRKMITPFFVQFIFWIGVLACVLTGAVQLFNGIKYYDGYMPIVFALLFLLAGPVVVRLYCEMIVVIFSINSTLTDILKQLKGKAE
ncbi:MAG: hypothetical protein CMJ19_13110 [Phycisphaeraceae bacterium]|nr:hypothetical protein [Phycisphaeraceae bacterium]